MVLATRKDLEGPHERTSTRAFESWGERMGTNIEICDEIRRARWIGRTRCDVLDGTMNLIEAASAFKLTSDMTRYRGIGTQEAEAIAVRLLRTGLAYQTEIMSKERATELWRRFLEQFQDQDMQLFTNTKGDAGSWTSATSATFDMGVVVIGKTGAGCLWVEEED
jgi:hypothetical protein